MSGNDPVTTEATTMLGSLDSLTAQANLEGLVSPDGQNYVVPVSNVEPVPEPMTAGCFLLGLGAWGCINRLRAKRR